MSNNYLRIHVKSKNWIYKKLCVHHISKLHSLPDTAMISVFLHHTLIIIIWQWKVELNLQKPRGSKIFWNALPSRLRHALCLSKKSGILSKSAIMPLEQWLPLDTKKKTNYNCRKKNWIKKNSDFQCLKAQAWFLSTKKSGMLISSEWAIMSIEIWVSYWTHYGKMNI